MTEQYTHILTRGGEVREAIQNPRGFWLRAPLSDLFLSGRWDRKTLEEAGWTITERVLAVREQVEALPVGTRFIVHYKTGSQSLFWRREGGPTIADEGDWAWKFDQWDHIEVIPEVTGE